MKKYKVLKKYPKQIMNSSRMVTLEPGTVVHLKHERQVDRLVMLGYLKEIHEIQRREPKPAALPKPTQNLVSPKKPRSKSHDERLDDKTGE